MLIRYVSGVCPFLNFSFYQGKKKGFRWKAFIYSCIYAKHRLFNQEQIQHITLIEVKKAVVWLFISIISIVSIVQIYKRNNYLQTIPHFFSFEGENKANTKHICSIHLPLLLLCSIICIFKHMNFIDIIIALPLLWAIYKGFRRGFIVELASLIGFWLGIWGSIHFSASLVPMLKKHFQASSSSLTLLAFLLTFLLIILLIYLLAKLIQKAVESMAMGLLNKLAGALFGLLKSAFVISVFIYALGSHISISQKKDSILYTTLGKIAPVIMPQLKELRFENLNDVLNQ